MISEALNTLRTLKPFFILNILLTLSISLMIFDDEIIKNPVSIKSFAIPIIGLLSYSFVWMWIEIVIWVKHLLPREDLVNLGAWIACSIFAFAVLLTFSFLSVSAPDNGISLIGRPGFTYTLTLYALANLNSCSFTSLIAPDSSCDHICPV